MPLDYIYFLSDGDASDDSTSHWAQIPTWIELKSSTTATTANRFRMTTYWYEYTDTAHSSYQIHSKTSTISYTRGTQTTGRLSDASILLSDFTNPNLVATGFSLNLRPRVVCEWLDGSTVLESETFYFYIVGKGGIPDWSYTVPSPYDSQYPLTNQSFYITSQQNDYNSTSSGAPHLWMQPYSGIKMNQWAEGMFEYNGSQYQFSYQYASSYITNPAIDARVMITRL